MSAMGRLLLITLSLLLTACGSAEKRQDERAAAIHAAFASEEAGATAGAEEVQAALLPPLQLNVPGVDQAQLERRFDVSVRRVQAGEFFMGLVAGTPYNMLVHPQVGGRITLEQKNVTVPEVMEMVRNVYGYPFKRTGDSFQVFPNTMHTRLFKVDYLSVVRNGRSRVHSAPGRLTGGGSGNNAAAGAQQGGAQEGSAGGQDTTLGSTVVTRHESDFWAELRQALEVVVGSEGGRRIAINTQTGMVMVHAMPDELRAVEDYLAASQQSANHQVILEARILEVELSDGYQSGINWATLQQSGGTTYSGGMLNGGTIFGGAGVGNNAGSAVLMTPTATPPAWPGATDAFGGVFGLAINSADFSGFIELLSTQGDVHVLSSPRVSTVNNQKAVIKVGADEFFVTGLTTTYQDVNGVMVPNVSVDLDEFFSGVALDVTPQVSDAGEIVLHVHPAVSDVKEQVKVIGTAQGNITMPLAANAVRESDTVVRALDGQLVVIGGLMQNSSTDEDAGVPYLSEIPILGGLFKHSRVSERKSELVILIKPTLVDSDGAQWREQLQRSSLGMRALERP